MALHRQGSLPVIILLLFLQAQAFASWKDIVAYRHVKRGALLDSVRHLMQGSLGRAFAGWRTQVHDKAALKQRAVQCLARLTHCHTASAFASWVDWAADQKDHRSAAWHLHATEQLHDQKLQYSSPGCSLFVVDLL